MKQSLQRPWLKKPAGSLVLDSAAVARTAPDEVTLEDVPHEFGAAIRLVADEARLLAAQAAELRSSSRGRDQRVPGTRCPLRGRDCARPSSKAPPIAPNRSRSLVSIINLRADRIGRAERSGGGRRSSERGGRGWLKRRCRHAGDEHID